MISYKHNKRSLHRSINDAGLSDGLNNRPASKAFDNLPMEFLAYQRGYAWGLVQEHISSAMRHGMPPPQEAVKYTIDPVLRAQIYGHKSLGLAKLEKTPE